MIEYEVTRVFQDEEVLGDQDLAHEAVSWDNTMEECYRHPYTK